MNTPFSRLRVDPDMRWWAQSIVSAPGRQPGDSGRLVDPEASRPANAHAQCGYRHNLCRGTVRVGYRWHQDTVRGGARWAPSCAGVVRAGSR